MENVRKINIEQLRYALNLRDLSNPDDGLHVMQVLMADILTGLEKAWGCSHEVYRESPIVTIEDNYDRLHYPADGASRNARYSRYVCDSALLRTQASAMVPRAMRKVAEGLPDDIVLACPGLTYRRDAVDRIHSAEPHHLDLWRVKKSSSLGERDLHEMIRIVLDAAIPGVEWKVIQSPHPYTLAGVEINARWGDGWLEVGECGLAHPKVLQENIPQYEGLSGLAMGLGLDRLLMVRKGIPDIRLLRSTDKRVATQMLDLLPYREVSSMPPVVRDLSIAVDADANDDDLGDKVREALGTDADIIEVVETVSETPYEALPEPARQRIGMGPHQKNILLRVVMRALDRTLTHEECNQYRDTIYAAVHEGMAWQWNSKDRAG